MRATFILFFITFFIFQPAVSAQEMQSTESARVVNAVEYALPYPGILPNSPFYSLKMFRDRVIGSLISDPLKKAEFSLLQADKRLQAGIFLLHQDPSKGEVAIATISKGENYFFDAILIAEEARRKKLAVRDVAIKLSNAAEKHEEVLVGISASISDSQQAAYEKELERVRVFQKRVKPLIPR